MPSETQPDTREILQRWLLGELVSDIAEADGRRPSYVWKIINDYGLEDQFNAFAFKANARNAAKKAIAARHPQKKKPKKPKGKRKGPRPKKTWSPSVEVDKILAESRDWDPPPLMQSPLFAAVSTALCHPTEWNVATALNTEASRLAEEMEERLTWEERFDQTDPEPDQSVWQFIERETWMTRDKVGKWWELTDWYWQKLLEDQQP
jgi:hypothetical protein